MNIIHSSLTIRSLEANDIPLGGMVTVRQGGDNDGNMGINYEASDRDAVMSKLVGVVLEIHALKSMVIPSHAGTLGKVLDFLKTERGAESDPDRIDELDDLIESMERSIGSFNDISVDR